MRTAAFLGLVLALCALCAGCRETKPQTPAAAASGTSPETAVVIQAKGEKDGNKDERDWLVKHYPDYQIQKQSIERDKRKQKIYDRVQITYDGGKRAVTLYFDVTKCFGKDPQGRDVHFY